LEIRVKKGDGGMSTDFSLSDYMSNGIENIIKGIIKASLKNPRETAFVVRYAIASRDAKKIRESFIREGHNVPAFLISSITSNCNLFCKGCYARANKFCGEGLQRGQLTDEKWGDIFKEAKELGISFVLLAGGEPLLRRGVLEKAAEVEEIMFPVFTNGTMLKDEYINLFDRHRNIVPILSIEGYKEQTDSRRGEGTYEILMGVMEKLKEKGVLYGVSVTVTTENINMVTGKDFIEVLHKKGCRAVIFVEYVPVSEATKTLAPTAVERKLLDTELQKLREQYEGVVFLSFPGDEKYSGGCLAAGRGFFHINADGSAEPCPFSPYSDTNLKNCTLKEALNSPLFRKLKETGMLLGEHDGGCLLFEKESEVKSMIDKSIYK
jgi:MoaA/NifB/PqqE/SkfB family radical SAM enzyme